MKISRENIDALSAVIKIGIEKSDYQEKVEKTLKNHAKKVQMPGFRAGKVPASMVQKMYGKSVLVEEINKMVFDELNKYISENQIHVLGEPIPSEKQDLIDFDTQENFTFAFDVAVAPEVSVNLSKDTTIPAYSIEIDEAMVQEQVLGTTSRFGTNEIVEAVTESSMVKADLFEVDAKGNVLEGGIQNLGAMLSVKIIKDEAEKAKLIGAGNGDSVILNIDKAYPNATEKSYLLKVSKELAEANTSDFRVDISEITDYKAAELNEELFKKLYGEAVTTEEQFKDKVKEEIAAALAYESDFRFAIDAKKAIMDKQAIALPELFLKRWLVAANHDKKDITPEIIDAELPKFFEELKWNLVKNQIIKEASLKIEADDVKKVAIKTAKMQFMQYGLNNVADEHLESYAMEMLKNQEQSRQYAEEAIQNKVLEYAKEQANVVEKKISREEFNKLWE